MASNAEVLTQATAALQLSHCGTVLFALRVCPLAGAKPRRCAFWAQAALRYAPGSLARLLCFLAIPLGSLSYPPVFAQLTLATAVLEMTSVRSSQCCLLVLVYCSYCYGLELQHQCKSHPFNLFIPSITIHLSSSIPSIDNPRCWSLQTWTRSSTR